MDFKPIKSEKVYENVIRQMKENIYKGNLKKGTKLPSERELSSILGVSRAAVREALSALDVLGVVETKPGEGTYIVNDVSSAIRNALACHCA